MSASLNGEGIHVGWRYATLILVSILVTAFSGYFAFGVDAIKHSEIDDIMSKRAPYMHDKARIDENFSDIKQRLSDLEKERK